MWPFGNDTDWVKGELLRRDRDINRLGRNIQELCIKQNILKEEICKLKTVEEVASLERIWKEISDAIDRQVQMGVHKEIPAELEKRLKEAKNEPIVTIVSIQREGHIEDMEVPFKTGIVDSKEGNGG